MELRHNNERNPALDRVQAGGWVQRGNGVGQWKLGCTPGRAPAPCMSVAGRGLGTSAFRGSAAKELR